jgi:hypothetical protein
MNPTAIAVHFDATDLVVILADGRTLRVPLSSFPRLLAASLDERSRVRISFSGKGLHWHELDEDISVDGLLGARRDQGPQKLTYRLHLAARVPVGTAY